MHVSDLGQPAGFPGRVLRPELHHPVGYDRASDLSLFREHRHPERLHAGGRAPTQQRADRRGDRFDRSGQRLFGQRLRRPRHHAEHRQRGRSGHLLYHGDCPGNRAQSVGELLLPPGRRYGGLYRQRYPRSGLARGLVLCVEAGGCSPGRRRLSPARDRELLDPRARRVRDGLRPRRHRPGRHRGRVSAVGAVGHPGSLPAAGHPGRGRSSRSSADHRPPVLLLIRLLIPNMEEVTGKKTGALHSVRRAFSL